MQRDIRSTTGQQLLVWMTTLRVDTVMWKIYSDSGKQFWIIAHPTTFSIEKANHPNPKHASLRLCYMLPTLVLCQIIFPPERPPTVRTKESWGAVDRLVSFEVEPSFESRVAGLARVGLPRQVG